MIEPRPGLVPLTFDGPSWQPFVPLAGIALEVEVETGSKKGKGAKYGHFREDLLFTHRGLSGPAILQISSYWQPGTPIVLNLLPELDVETRLSQFARWCLDADAQGRALGLSLPGVRVPLGTGPEHLAGCLAALALFDADMDARGGPGQQATAGPSP